MTDVFRLLTRSAVFAKRPSDTSPIFAPPAPTQSLPRAPTKRKNSSDSRDASTTTTPLPQDLDFFGLSGKARGTLISSSKKRRAEEEAEDASDDNQSSDGHSSSEEEADGDVSESGMGLPPTPEETRSILRQHKLKFTLLNPLGTKSVNHAKKKKKKSATSEVSDSKRKQKKPEILVPPITDFDQLRSTYQLSKRVYSNILAQGHISPTEVQMGSLPVFLNDSLSITGAPEGSPIDLLICAPTGSGKTLAYIVPVLNRILASRDHRKGVKAVIIAPTKELVGQIVTEVKKLANGTGIRVSQMKKGMHPVSSEATTYSEEGAIKSDILVSTPLILLHALENGESSLNMSGIQNLVLDEADVLLDELFRTQTLGIWRHLRARSHNLRVSLWSATISSSTEELAIAELTSASPSSSAIVRLIVGIKDTSLPTISQSLLYTATEPGKLLALRQLFTTSLRPPILIFLQSIQRAQALYNEILYDLPIPGRIAVLHADLTDTARSDIMTRFRRGDVWVLITTDLLARGMDFRGVRLVLNYDIPTSVAAYIHRVGRTGRAGREGGEAVTYYTKEDIGYVKGIANVIQASGKGVEQWLLDALPKTGKREKKRLKLHGMQARSGAKISTKSGYERKVEERRRGAKEGSKRRKEGGDDGGDDREGREEWRGFSD